MRLNKSIQQLPSTLAFNFGLPAVMCVLRLSTAANFPGAKYLPFGYCVRSRKRADA